MRHVEPPWYSLVVPVFNEAAALPALAEEIAAAMDTLPGTYECIFVDDGSTDETPAILAALRDAAAPTVRIVRFDENRGQGAALYAGLRLASGDLVVTLDGDGQSNPGDIPLLVRRLLDRRLDLVCGIRVTRRDSALRKAMSRLANAVRSRFLHDRVRDAGCALKVMRRSVVPALLPIKTLYSFIPAFAVTAGFRVGELPVAHRPRRGGRSSYGLRVFLYRPLVDMLGVKWHQTRCILQRDDLVREDAYS